MEQLRETSFSRFLLIVGFSFLLHLLCLIVLQDIPTRHRVKIEEKVRVSVTAKPKPIVDESPPPLPQPLPKTAAKTRAPQPTKTRLPNQSPPPPPVLGLNPESLSQDGKASFAVPLGNTTDARDEGKRLSPEEVRGLAKDLSRDAELIAQTFISPPYTDTAEDAGLEGLFVVEVFVDAFGKVTDAELRSKIGYGMDARVLETVKRARFKPRMDPLGRSVEGWTEIKVRLTLE